MLFMGSGCAALVYEVVWLQMMSLIIGSSAISLGILLGVYMGGMCAGSLMLSRFVSRREHPLRVYALLEGGIGICGIVVFFVMPYVGGLYIAIAGHGIAGLLLRGLFCAICLLPPTVLMGATLPAVARWVEATPRGVSWLGFFYGGNIAGAVIGCLLAGYYLLRVYDVLTATAAAVAINAAVALSGFLLARRASYQGPADAKPSGIFAVPEGSWAVYVTIGLSGFTALGSEVIWTGLLSLNLGATTYTFSLILAVLLFGLGIGSSLGAALARSLANARSALGWCQLLLVAGIGWAAYAMTQALPYWPVDPELSISPLFTFQVDLAKTLFTVLPGALLWGASFPLALAATGSRDSDPGVIAGTTYAANTVGAILGALMTSLVLIPRFGSQHSQQLMMAVAGAAAIMMLGLWPAAGGEAPRFTPKFAGVLMLTLALSGWLVSTVIPVPPILVAYGRFAVRWLSYQREYVYVGEGMNSSMAVSKLPNGVLNYHNAGKVQASSEPQDMRLQRMLGHLATLLAKPAPRSVLVIGCGAGVTAGAVSIDPRLEREVIAEIEPLVPEVVSTYFTQYNFDVVRNPKVHVVIDDGRHYLLTTDEKFDAITSDPFDPWVKGAANLYTDEFFRLVRERLNPGGVVTVFVQLYESSTEAVKSEVRTFLEVFPEGLVFGNTHEGAGYDMILVGQATPGPIDIDEIQARLSSPQYEPVARSLYEIGMRSAVELLSNFAASGDQLSPWLADAQINYDRNLRLQYLAGFGLNKYDQARIYSEILQYRRLRPGLFIGSPAELDKLQTHNWQ